MSAVTIVTPSYNSAAFIGQTIESVQAQTFTDWQMIIVDDLSTDSSNAIIADYAARDPRIIPVILSENSGAAVARNVAIEKADGRFIAFLDSDDLWQPQKLEKQIAFMTAGGYGLTFSWYDRIDEAGISLDQTVRSPARVSYRDMLRTNYIGCLTAVYDTAQIGRAFMPLIRKRQDYGLWLQILRTEKFAYCLQESLALYRVRKGAISSNKLDLVRYNWALLREHEGLSLPASLYYLGWQIAAKLLR